IRLTFIAQAIEVAPPAAAERPSVTEFETIGLYQPLQEQEPPESSPDEPLENLNWRVVGAVDQVPAKAFGRVVHKALEMWLFPGDTGLDNVLESAALGAGYVAADQRSDAIRHALRLLARLHDHPLFEEIRGAEERYHELPYTRQAGSRTESGVFDLLYRHQGVWRVLDFKTDAISSEADRLRLVAEYSAQMNRYVSAASQLLQSAVAVRLCFLDDQGAISLLEFT
ncbi:MAG: PD-(D/E)XK nuclease family protein, partial [Anaerolineae bacterium]